MKPYRNKLFKKWSRQKARLCSVPDPSDTHKEHKQALKKPQTPLTTLGPSLHEKERLYTVILEKTASYDKPTYLL